MFGPSGSFIVNIVSRIQTQSSIIQLIMINQNLPPLQKLIAAAFLVMVLASFCFIGYRIITKSEYEENQIKQANILAVSVINTLAEKSLKDISLWDKFDSDNFIIIIDHRTVPGNWVLKTSIKKNMDHVNIESTVDSGWNSRSPISKVVSAKVFMDGKVVFDDIKASDQVKKLHADNAGKKHVYVFFRFPDERKPFPVKIRAAVTTYKDSENNDFIMLTSAN